jgi:hypothetical protein
VVDLLLDKPYSANSGASFMRRNVTHKTEITILNILIQVLSTSSSSSSINSNSNSSNNQLVISASYRLTVVNSTSLWIAHISITSPTFGLSFDLPLILHLEKHLSILSQARISTLHPMVQSLLLEELFSSNRVHLSSTFL